MTDEPLHSNLSEALYAIREEVGPLMRGGEADTGKFTYKFVQLPALVEKVDPIAKKHGVFIRHQLTAFFLRHELWFNGESVEVWEVPLPNPQETAQGLGSAITYMRRYDYTTTFGLVVDLDDDGAAASTPPAAATVHREPPARSSEPLQAKAEALAATHAQKGEIDEDF